ncbi:MAG: prolipoprotein diacylglyceryl transferase [Flavobacteriales bacterium]|nr:prolipoprotein diacylglyceryl transferase [Flavobacteriales bacterium]
MKKYWEKLKQKWNIDSDQRMIKIWVIFAITGSFTVFVRKSLFKVLGIHIDAKWLAFLVKLVAIYFIYQLLLFLIGSILGESKFFGWFIKKMNYRFIGKKVEN